MALTFFFGGLVCLFAPFLIPDSLLVDYQDRLEPLMSQQAQEFKAYLEKYGDKPVSDDDAGRRLDELDRIASLPRHVEEWRQRREEQISSVLQIFSLGRVVCLSGFVVSMIVWFSRVQSPLDSILWAHAEEKKRARKPELIHGDGMKV